jgi:hypothetical protein
MEQDNLFKNFIQISPRYNDPGIPGADKRWHQGSPRGVTNNFWAATKLKMFKCPSDTVDEQVAGATLHSFMIEGCTLTAWTFGLPAGDAYGRTNYTGSAGGWSDALGGCAWYAQWKGIFVHWSDRVIGTNPAQVGLGQSPAITLGQLTVQDGTSNTLMYGEGIGSNGTGVRFWAWTWAGMGIMPTTWGLGKGQDPNGGGAGAEWYKYSSRHAAVVQFCFGDCSTRGVRFGTTTSFFTEDWYVLQQMGGRNDGQNRDTAVLLD